MDNKIGQLFLIGISGTELTQEEAEFIAKNNIAGVTLFGRNLETPQQVHKLCSDIHALKERQADKLPLLIGIDMEGGRVHRLKTPFTQWPALKNLGDIDSTSIAFRFAQCMGDELRAVGINLDYSPCIDVLTNSDNVLIGDRAISSDPEQVAKIASAITRGYIKAGVLPCAKHFPGHGNTLVDSHEGLPIEKEDLDTLLNRELVPFKKVFRARLDLLMTAHIKFENIDPDWPVTLSKKFLKDILRDQLKYRNIVMSDDLDMKALSLNYGVEETAIQALNAGCDILLYCNEPDSPRLAIEAVKKSVAAGDIDPEHISQAYDKVVNLKQKNLKNFSMPTWEEASKVIGHPEHMRVAKAVGEQNIPEDLKST